MNKILNDKRYIESIRCETPTAALNYCVKGKTTRITPEYELVYGGQYTSWFQVWQGDRLAFRVNARFVSEVRYMYINDT